MSDLDKLVKALCELNSELDERVVRFVGESEGVERLKDLLKTLLLVEQMKK